MMIGDKIEMIHMQCISWSMGHKLHPTILMEALRTFFSIFNMNSLI
jgi:hypothetical protein